MVNARHHGHQTTNALNNLPRLTPKLFFESSDQSCSIRKFVPQPEVSHLNHNGRISPDSQAWNQETRWLEFKPKEVCSIRHQIEPCEVSANILMICSNHKIAATYVHRIILEIKQCVGRKPWGFFINCRMHSDLWGLLLKFRPMQIQAFSISQFLDHSSVLNKEFHIWCEYLQWKEIEHLLCTQETHKLMRKE